MTKPIVKYWINGNKMSEKYYLNGQLHRYQLEGPAFIVYRDNGQVIRNEYWLNGELHNPYGPAFINYIFNIFEWWFNDKHYTIEVNEYLKEYNLIWQNMTQTDFDIMWMNIL